MAGVRLVLGILVLASCSRTFHGTAVQPNPVVEPSETLRISEKITIVTGDMDLDQPDPAVGDRTASPIHNHHYPLVNAASFTMVSRDRLRFHVQVDHKWEEWADLTSWEVFLVDDQGRRWTPESVEHVRTRVITSMWDREQRTSICDRAGRDANNNCFNTIGVANDGWRRRQTLGSLSVYRGNADFVFYERDLMSANVHWMRLVVRRSGQAFEFTWRFDDTVAAE